jgi:serine/threonine protein kinase/formylglycine-generating enzyme required for sulfatase activity
MSARAVTCPPAHVLADFYLGRLDDAGVETIGEHLETCASCREVMAGISGDSFLLRLRTAHRRQPGAARQLPKAQVTQLYVTDDSISMDGRGAETPSGQSAYIPGVPSALAAFPDYEIVRELGHGGMGTVYLARNRIMDRLEVLKVINKVLMGRPEAQDRFQQEIRAAAKLSHPNIVGAYSVLQPGDLLVFAMEYVRGQDLGRVVKQHGPLPVANAAFYTFQVALGLQHAFEEGMVHRDIKPGNLMLALVGKRHVVKILDFGLAKATSEKEIDNNLTSNDQILGTPDYMAPEQGLQSREADIRADIYGLGCTLYYLLAGRPPFQSKNLYELLNLHRTQQAPQLNQLRPDVPVELATIVSKMMAKNPAERFQTPKEIAKALNPFFKSASQASPVRGDLPPSINAVCLPVATLAIPPAMIRHPSGPASLQVAQPRLVSTNQPGKLDRRSRATFAIGICGLFVAIGIFAWIMASSHSGRDSLTVEANVPPDLSVGDDKTATVWDSRNKAKREIEPAQGSQDIELKKDVDQIEIPPRGKRLILPEKLDTLVPSPAVAPFDQEQAHEFQEKWSNRLQIPIENTNSIGMRLVLIPPGVFEMGSSIGQVEAAMRLEEQFKAKAGPEAIQRILESETPLHRVTLTKPFLMGSTELTVGQFRRFVEATRYVTVLEKGGGGGKYDEETKKHVRDPSYTWKAPGHEVTEDSPVSLGDEDAIAFCNWLSGKEHFRPCYTRDANGHFMLSPSANGYRLPTEAEWEFACRAGTTGLFSSGDDVTQLERYEWYAVCSGRISHPVGQKLPNPFGLYDMQANVHEWCQDWFAADYYTRSTSTDPTGPDSGKGRVTRGGCFYADRRTSRSANRSFRPRDAFVAFETFGARIVRSLPVPPESAAQGGLEPSGQSTGNSSP